jgi:phage N-6-adenine-methyltransferase
MASSLTIHDKIHAATTAIAEAGSLADVLKLHDRASALEAFVKAAKDSLATSNAATALKLRCERRAGELLAAMEKPKNQHAGNTMLPPSLDDLGIDKMQSSRWQREAKVDEETFEQYVTACTEKGVEVTQAGLLKIANGSHVSLNSGENEWYTPPEYIEAARAAMGGIDLDPASCETAQANVKARRFYTIDDNGLEKKWAGNVWLNPPYSKDLIGLFAEKVVSESERFLQAVVLVNNATDTAWFHRLVSVASAVCFFRGRIRFLDKTGKPANTPVQGQAAIYIGPNVDSFRRAFGGFGFVVSSINSVEMAESTVVDGVVT